MFIMLIRPISYVVAYVAALNESLKQISSKKLTKSQRLWLIVVLMGLIVTGSFNWAAFERRSLGKFKESGLRWVFRRAKMAWAYLLQASIAHILSHYDLKKGVLVLDDSDKMRSRNTSKIAGVHKVKDKKTGGYFEGQEFVFLLLVTDKITIPIGFRFYVPNPAIRKWKETMKAQKKAGIPAKNREKYPPMDPKYPSKQMLGLELLKMFSQNHSDVIVQAVLADALYGNQEFMDTASQLTHCTQVISQLRTNQLVRYRGKNISLNTYFSRTAGVTADLVVRGGKTKKVTVLAARLHVKSHKKKRFIIALKYEGEMDYRFIVASDLSWRHMDVVRTYTLRWLVEVFIADWKAHGGWNKLSKQQGVDSATNGVTLSLLCDHLLILHPLQSALIKNKQPGMSVGCLVERINAEALLDGVNHIVNAEDPAMELRKFSEALENSMPNYKSSKHLAGRDLGRMEPTPSLRYQKAA
jgi:hypothetical protein